MARSTRRDFIQGSAAALAVGAAMNRSGREGHAAPTGRMTMNLSLGHIGVRANPRETLDLAAKHGFDSINPEPGFLTGLSEGQLDEHRGRMSEKNLVWAAAGLPIDLRGDDAAYAKGLGALPEVAATLERAGAERVGTWIMSASAELTYRANFQRTARRLRECAKILNDHGLRLGLEYLGPVTLWTSQINPFVHTMAETKELIAEIGASNVGFVLDSWHWWHAGETDADILTLTNEDIVAVDLNDAPKDQVKNRMPDSPRELPCATGVIPMESFMQALAKIGYDGPARAEPFVPELRTMPAHQAVAKTAKAMMAAFAFLPA